MSTITSNVRRRWQKASVRTVPDLRHMPPAVRNEVLDRWWADERTAR